MSQEDNPSPQGDSTSKTPLPSATPKNQANSTPATESEEPNNLTAETLSEEGEGIVEECGRFKERLHNIKELPHNINKYITEDNPILDSNETHKKYPIDTLVSIFKIQKKDHKIIFWISVLLLTHMISYYLKWIYLVDLFRIAITAIFLIFAIKNTYSAYQNRPIIVDSFKKHPLQFFTTIIAIGGLFALVIPAAMNVLKLIGDSSALTTAILTITGGFIAVFGLIKSHQKSELEREQLETQKQKDARDHIRQLHDSYNDRFDKAVAELYSNDVKAAYAAVPKLAKLADAWLDYKDLSNDTEELEKLKKKAEKEAQTIINILCKYIRTMPGEYTEEDLKDIDTLNTTEQDKLKNESEVRRLIFSEISDRSSEVTIENDKIFTTPGVWSNFDFDFSRAPIFYPLNNLTIEQGNFSGAKVYIDANFIGVTFTGIVDFTKARFTHDANFSEAAFTRSANFSKAVFIRSANFSGARFTRRVNFSGARFDYTTIFSGAAFTRRVNFSEARFTRRVNFRRATFTDIVDFTKARFTHEAYFSEATFTRSANFSKAVFTRSANFSGATFIQRADFNWATFARSANFSRATFISSANFNRATFTGIVDFTKARFRKFKPTFTTKLEHAQFSAGSNPQDYKFSCLTPDRKTIKLGTATLLGKPFEIPLGTVLFDPDSPKDQRGNYAVQSEPAK